MNTALQVINNKTCKENTTRQNIYLNIYLKSVQSMKILPIYLVCTLVQSFSAFELTVSK